MGIVFSKGGLAVSVNIYLNISASNVLFIEGKKSKSDCTVKGVNDMAM